QVTLDDTVPSAPVAPQKWNASDEPASSSEQLVPVLAGPPAIDVAVDPVSTASERVPAIKSSRLLIAIGAVVALAVVAGIAGVIVALAGEDPPMTATTEAPAPAEPELAQVEPELDLPPPSEVQAPSVDPAPEEDELAAVEAPEPAPRRVPRRTRRAEPEGPSALDEARDCLARNDRQCAKRILEARARTVAEHALLIDTYRSLGEINPMLDRMERFVRRYPNARQSASYREDLRRYGR